jgi:hypothetical protein
MVKIIVLAFGYDIYTPTSPTFTDVPVDHPFYVFVETAAYNNIVSGYDDGTFRPYANVTRGQLSKIVVVAATWPNINPPEPTFTDVPISHPFYTFIETAACHQIISGYSDGTFRPFSDATRGQISKIVYLAVIDDGTLCIQCPPDVGYDVTTSTATVVPGEHRITPNRCDDCTLRLVPPFSYDLYGVSYTTIDVSENGNIRFVDPTAPTPTATPPPDFRSFCLPSEYALRSTIYGYWTNLDVSVTAECLDCGIYTRTTGVAPNRIFSLEWRAKHELSGDDINFEV